MIPLRDNIDSRTTPYVNYALIAICVVVFLFQIGDETGRMIERFGMIPGRVAHPDTPVMIRDQQIVVTPVGYMLEEFERPAERSPVPAWLTLLTCVFLHGGWLHLIGNMLFLWIFGDNVEDRLGHVRYALFYLVAGVVASLVHLLSGPESTIPTIGASGAVAGVMGAYLLLYPHAKVLTVIPIFFFLHMMVIPAPFFLGIWFVLQFFQGVASVGSVQSGGVAWWAHIGGFVLGFVVIWICKQRSWLSPAVVEVRPRTSRFGQYRVRRRRDW